jgi:biotin transporter BioY
MVPVAALMAGFVPFIIGDAIKVSAVYVISQRLP